MRQSSFKHYIFKHNIALFVLVSLFTFTSLAISQETSRAPIATPVKPSAQQDNASSKIAQFTELKATITKITGSVTVRNRGAFFWHDAKVGEFLSAGDQIVTKADGKIEFKLDNGNTVKLKPQTRLVIKKLTQNNITGDYENFFEVNTGKVWAKIEKLSGKSSFKIKTPTAIAGARGTIIYLVVYPDSTMVLFEEGKGFFTDASLEQTFEVDPGRIYEFDSQGNFSETTEPLPEQLQELTEDWDIDIGTAEGYSPPEEEEEGGGEDDVEDDVDDTTEDQEDSEEDEQKNRTNSQGADKPGYKDTDGDDHLDVNDDFPSDPSEWIDTDSDGIGDNADTDDDGDGYSDSDENDNGTDPLSSESVPSDNDGDYTSDLNDPDDDNDGRLDVNDAFPLDPNEWLDTDSDGVGDN
ncbi:MAG: FecR domain-containing protein, partial [Candidatus Omnitrophica bacterium]|nr:FecR domain-containing protein [Candidatus Omnitrophota bacterium]